MSSVASLVEPAFHSSPARDFTDAEDVADLCEMAGFTPDPEQRLVLDDIFAVRGDKLAAFEVALVAPRQNLKTGLLKMAALGWLYITEQRLIVWSAHEFRTAQEAFRDMTELIESCPSMDRRVKQIHRGNGDEAIELLTGQRIIFKARTKGGGRGLSGDKVVLDEAFALRPVHMGALLPTLSARPDPQVVYASSAGLADSDVLRGIRDRGRAGGDPSLAYVEYCDDLPGGCESQRCSHALGSPGCVLDDPRRWARANTAMGRRISVEYIAAERRALPPAEFGRERHGWWDDAEDTSGLDFSNWPEMADAHSHAVSGMVYGLAVSPDREWAALAVAGRRADGMRHVDVGAHVRGTSSVVQTIAELDRRHGITLVVDGGGPAASLTAELQNLGVDLKIVGVREVAQSFGLFMDAVRESSLRHRDQPELAAAIRSARRRAVGDGAFAFGRKASGEDITPLEAAGLALLGHQDAQDHGFNIW